MRRRIVAVGIAVVALLAVAAGGVAAQEEQPEPVPPTFHGTVSAEDGQVPEGTEVVALVGGEERGSATVGPDGSYGGPQWTDDQLLVRGTRDDRGRTVTFEVNGVEAEQTATWRPGETIELNLTVDELDGDGSNPGLAVGDGRRTEDGDAPEDGETGTPKDGTAEDDTGDDGGSDDSVTDDGGSDDNVTDGDGGERRGDGDDGGSGAIPGFGASVALCSMLVAALLLVRRQ